MLLKSYYDLKGVSYSEEEIKKEVEDTFLPEGCGNPVSSYYFVVEIPKTVDKGYLYSWLNGTGCPWQRDTPQQLEVLTHPCDPILLELVKAGCQVYHWNEDMYLHRDGWVKK